MNPANKSEQAVRAEDVEWIVNDMAELGVKIGEKFFWLYKGRSIDYSTGDNPNCHDDGRKIKWRPVGKREFGECCHPWYAIEKKSGVARLPETYVGFHEGDDELPLWKELP